MWSRKVCAVLLALALSLAAHRADPLAQAAPQANLVLTVNSAADAPAALPLDNGICQTAPDNTVCTLRAAIMKANHWHAGSVTILLPALPMGSTYQLTIPPTGPDDESTGDLNLISSTGRPLVTLEGQNDLAVIDASGLAPADRVLDIASGVNASLLQLWLTGGQSILGGGLTNAGNLNLKDSFLVDNHAVTAGLNPGRGGAIFNSGRVVLFADELLNNTASAGAAGIENEGGVISLTNSLVGSNTSAGSGGGIENDAGSLTLAQTEVSYNNADTAAGIDNNFGVLTMTASALDNNTAANHGTSGGGLFNDCGTAFLVNSTVSSNFGYGSGGGVANIDGIFSCGTVLQLYNATLAFNVAAIGGSGQGGGIFNGSSRGVELQNTILSNNQLGLAALNPSDCSGLLVSHSYNLISSSSGCTLSGTATGNLINQFALLRPLNFNGGLTPSHALNPTSPAVDAGNPAGCTDELAAALTTDQRLAPRPANGRGQTRCDMGAYELQRTLDLPLLERQAP